MADAYRSRMAGRDPLFIPWLEAHAGEPVMVHTVDGVPAYWLVPVDREARVIGFVRVIGAGRVAAAGAYYRRPEELSACPTVVTGVTRSEAEAAAVEAAEAAADQLVSSRFVQDGPPGREAWLVEVGPRRFFVTPGGVRETRCGSGLSRRPQALHVVHLTRTTRDSEPVTHSLQEMCPLREPYRSSSLPADP